MTMRNNRWRRLGVTTALVFGLAPTLWANTIGSPNAYNGWSSAAHITTRASSQHSSRWAQNSIDGSAIWGPNGEYHSTGIGHAADPSWSMWMGTDPNAAARGGTVAGSHWIEYKFDKTFDDMGDLEMWNYNEVGWHAMGLKDITVQYTTVDGPGGWGSVNPGDWNTAFDGELPRAAGVTDQLKNLTVDFGGASAKYVVITGDAGPGRNWSGDTLNEGSLSEVRFQYDFTLQPVSASVRDHGGQHGSRPWTLTTDGSGMYGQHSDIHSNFWGEMGLGSGGLTGSRGGTVAGSYWVEYDLGQSRDLQEMRIWNYNEGSWTVMGMKEVTIQYSLTGGTDPGEWTTIFDGQIQQSDGTAGSAADLMLEFGGAAAQYIVVTADVGVDVNWSSGAYTDAGLSEVMFFIPEPATALLLIAGGLLLWRRR